MSAQTLSADAPTPHDDQLFLFHASSLLRGEWMGPLSDLTLAKGPFYSLWLTLNHHTGMRLLLSQAILYAVACVALVCALRPLLREAWRRALLYLVVLFNPASWADGPATRVLREGIYPALSMLLLGLAIGAALRLRDRSRDAALWASAAGLVAAVFAMTREEGVWLAPSLCIVVWAGLARARRSSWRTWLPVGAAAAIAYLVPTSAVAAMNWRRYGLYETCEMGAGYYRDAYGALTRVKTTTWRPQVPVAVEARAKVFAVSAAFREIAPYLERSAKGWTSHGCKAMGVCDDIAGGWFMWAFRAAVTTAGEYRDGRVARTWYERLAREVDQACDAGALECLPRRSGWMPPWSAEYLRPLTSALGRAAVFASRFDKVTPYSSPPRGDEAQLAEFEHVTNELVPRQITHLQGVLTSPAEIVAVVVDHAGNPVPASIQRGLATSVAAASGGERRTIPIAVTVECTSDCALLLMTADGRSMAVPIADPSQARGDPTLEWSTDRMTVEPVDPPDVGQRGRLVVLAALTRAYAWTIPSLSVAAVLLLAWRLLRAALERNASLLSFVALALLVAVGMRLLVLALVEVTSFPAITVLYMSPAHGFLVAFTALVLLGGQEVPRPCSGTIR